MVNWTLVGCERINETYDIAKDADKRLKENEKDIGSIKTQVDLNASKDDIERIVKRGENTFKTTMLHGVANSREKCWNLMV